MKRSIFSNFPTEKLIFHKASGETFELIGLITKNNTILSEEVSILIEPDDYFERKLPNGIIEFFKVIDTGYIKGTTNIPEHYETKVKKVKPNQMFSHTQKESEKSKNNTGIKVLDRDEIFISHRSTDASVADMIKDFLVNTGIPNEKVFCSSLPGNDVKEMISPEVKERLNKCSVIILILSQDFYDSPYCLNEAGIAWYLDAIVSIPIGLPEITSDNMIGFYNNDYKLRRLDNDGDISYLYDTAQERLNATNIKHSVITQETKKLEARYSEYISKRTINILDKKSISDDTVPIDIDEGILLLYAAENKGYIIVSHSISRSGPSVEAGGYDFTEDDTPRECARWKAAVDKLVKKGLIECSTHDGVFFNVTDQGYKVSDQTKEKWEIDISKSPKENLEAIK